MKIRLTKQIKIGSDTVRYTVSGVMGDVPENSHFEANMIIFIYDKSKDRKIRPG